MEIDQDKTKEQLIEELAELHQRVAELEVSEAERKRAEEMLRESEGKYRHLFDNLNDAVFIADVETGVIIEANKEATRLLGRNRNEIIGMHQSELHPPEKADEYRRRFARHIQRGRIAEYDGEVVRRDG